MKPIIAIVLLCVCLFFKHIPVFSQQKGLPFISNYPPDVYKAAVQNWAIAQDKRGIMYFGNSDGILEYDGINWRRITLPLARGLAIDDSGRIFVGLVNDFGYLQANRSGVYEYISLKDKIAEKDREIDNVRSIKVWGGQVFFLTTKKIFILKNGHIQTVLPKKAFKGLHLVNDSLYVQEGIDGLMVYRQNNFRPIESDKRFIDGRVILLPFGKNEMLAVSRQEGLFVYSPLQENKFRAPANFAAISELLIKYVPVCATILDNGDYAIGTSAGGVIVFDPSGLLKNVYDHHSGLQDNQVFSLFLDRNKQLWAGLGNGISLIQDNLPFRNFNEQYGLKGNPASIHFFDGRLYAATSQYLCVQNAEGRFETVPGTEGQNWQLYETKGQLLLANQFGLGEIKGKRYIPMIEKTGILYMLPIPDQPDRLIAAVSDGLCVLRLSGGRWTITHPIKGFSQTVYKITFDKEGKVWVATSTELFRLELNKAADSVVAVMQGTKELGLPTNYGAPYQLNDGETVFGTEKGLYRFRSADKRFEPHPSFGKITGLPYPVQQQKNGDIWFDENKGGGIYEKGVFVARGKGFELSKQPFLKFTGALAQSYLSFYTAPDSTVYIATNKGLLQYKPFAPVDYNNTFHTLIREVYAKDSLLYGGATEDGNGLANIKGGDSPYSRNDFVFHFAAAFYEDAKNNLYSYRLIGSDTAWSAWVGDHKKEYTNIFEGEYTFEVKSKNQYGNIGQSASYSFRILPPWYRSWWAYLFYALSSGIAVWAIVKTNTARLEKEKKLLEQIVAKRTEEVMWQKEEIQQQAEEIAAQRDSILDSYENSKMLSDIGYQITSSLDLGLILDTVYQNLSKLIPSDIFGIGLYDAHKMQIHYRLAVESGKKYLPYSREMTDKNQFPVWCIENQKMVFINDLDSEYSRYLAQNINDTGQLLEDGTKSQNPLSLIYMPLIIQKKVLGIITVQSFRRNAYDEWHKIVLSTLGVYVASALENANSYDKSEKLLLNILPAQVADELKEHDHVKPQYYKQVSVLFTDFKGFTQLAEKVSPHELVGLLNHCFQVFDEICEKHGLEKIKTIGDSYMCAGGVPSPNTTNARDCVAAGLEMQAFMSRWKQEREVAGLPAWELRLGIHTGELIAGVIGSKKFSYDVWGDTVNTASRMESSGEPGRVNISEATYAAIVEPQGLRFHPDAQNWQFEYRGKIPAKGKGDIGMYFVLGKSI